MKPAPADNPYAPPEVLSGIAIGAAGEISRDGALLVARDGAPFPDRCVRCNQPAQGFRLKKTFYWHPSGWYLLVFVNILVYAIVAMAVRKKACFELALCPQHQSRRKLAIGMAFGVPLAGLLIAILSGGPMSFWWFLLALFLGAIIGIFGAQILKPVKIDSEHAYLTGAHPQFLASLPARR